jgi:hypothetical protein
MKYNPNQNNRLRFAVAYFVPTLCSQGCIPTQLEGPPRTVLKSEVSNRGGKECHVHALAFLCTACPASPSTSPRLPQPLPAHLTWLAVTFRDVVLISVPWHWPQFLSPPKPPPSTPTPPHPTWLLVRRGSVALGMWQATYVPPDSITHRLGARPRAGVALLLQLLPHVDLPPVDLPYAVFRRQLPTIAHTPRRHLPRTPPSSA